jgi:hypothetical protein
MEGVDRGTGVSLTPFVFKPAHNDVSEELKFLQVCQLYCKKTLSTCTHTLATPPFCGTYVEKQEAHLEDDAS